MNKADNTYTIESFLTNDVFINWVRTPTPALNTFWENWLKQNPDQEAVLKQAIDFVLCMDFEQPDISETQIHNIKRNIYNQLSQREIDSSVTNNKEQQANRSIFDRVRYNWYKVAAVLAGLLFLAGGTYRVFWRERLITYRTAYGQTLQIELPDHSVVNLNGNSTLKYAANWPNASTREVWLDGEAFFSVVHTPYNQKFLVRTSHQVNVEVLGTEFNVSKRQGRTQVVLSSGKVKLNIQETEQTSQVMLKPGEMVELKANSAGFIKKKVNPQVYTSWRNKILIFDNTPLPEVALNLKETYGLNVQLADSALNQLKVSGSTPIKDLDVLFAGLSKTFDLQITKNKKEVVFRKKTQEELTPSQ
ncbi:MAG: hypothetical protein COW65_05560 [Cytophagales bacterium CG18_big_fil_WC_8_21_14_2_50_42_9]|nr:MAG: hypothetical protein COW65_05560 [Cytophagales bacterium CG18_big_fil_WC_8_21_14_2_50_42_9]